MKRTHHNATFVLVTQDSDLILGISENGEVVVRRGGGFSALEKLVRLATMDSFVNEIPLVVVVGRTGLRASRDEILLRDFLEGAIDKVVARLPVTVPTVLGGALHELPNGFLKPRVVHFPLHRDNDPSPPCA